jgi:drug/metabolite transporter (DMT)-like permease
VSGRTLGLAAAALVAFAANSILCRLALRETAIDPVSFTTIRIAAGALMLGVLLVFGRRGEPLQAPRGGDWTGALALYAYAILFSYAYLALSAGTGALLLFGAVQLTMFGVALYKGERLDALQTAGLALAVGGVAWLLAPGVSAPPLTSALLMIGAGVAWGVYSLRGRGSRAPLADTAGNFLRAVPVALLVGLGSASSAQVDAAGALYAVASGALASGLGYALWYGALRDLSASRAATLQLAVPVLAALGGIALLDEAFTPRLLVATAAVLGGIVLVLKRRGVVDGKL